MPAESLKTDETRWKVSLTSVPSVCWPSQTRSVMEPFSQLGQPAPTVLPGLLVASSRVCPHSCWEVPEGNSHDSGPVCTCCVDNVDPPLLDSELEPLKCVPGAVLRTAPSCRVHRAGRPGLVVVEVLGGVCRSVWRACTVPSAWGSAGRPVAPSDTHQQVAKWTAHEAFAAGDQLALQFAKLERNTTPASFYLLKVLQRWRVGCCLRERE